MLINQLIESPIVFLAFIFALVIVLTVHEVAHGVVAYWLGDSTAHDQGRLSFNPLVHIDPVGALMLMTIGFGWGKPVPVDFDRLKYGKWGAVLVAIAGPVSNLLMVFFFAFIYKMVNPGVNPLMIGEGLSLLHIFLSYAIVYSALLMAFNLIPIPPLDGSKLLVALLPPSMDYFSVWLSRYGSLLLIGLLIFDSITPSLFGFSVLSSFFGFVLDKVSLMF